MDRDNIASVVVIIVVGEKKIYGMYRDQRSLVHDKQSAEREAKKEGVKKEKEIINQAKQASLDKRNISSPAASRPEINSSGHTIQKNRNNLIGTDNQLGHELVR